MHRKEIPAKNYLILGLLMLATLLVTLYWMTWYKTNQEYQRSHSVMTNFLAQINSTELDSYILDSPNAIIYFASSQDEQIKTFEKQLKKLILKYDIKDQFVYIDTFGIQDMSFYQNISKKYLNDNLKKKKVSFQYVPNMVMFENGEIIDILNKNNNKIDIQDVERFLEIYEVILKE